ncbi:MAG: capsule assembly Wzi family protein [Longimicrobiales bacterium]
MARDSRVAQDTGATQSAAAAAAPLWLGTPADVAHRDRWLFTTDSVEQVLLRSPLMLPLAGGSRQPGVRARAVGPVVDVAWNSDIPFSMNDGAIWAGRGVTTALMGGAWIETGPVFLLLAPQFIYTQNEEFSDNRLSTSPGGSPFRPPWYAAPPSADVPTRFGYDSFWRVDPGQSALGLRFGNFAGGASTANLWWGPGERNAIVMSNHAPGFPHLFIRPIDALQTGIGPLRFDWILGTLTESLYFDTQLENDDRSLSGLAVTLAPEFAPGLTTGVARVVYAALVGSDNVFSRGLDALIDGWGEDETDEQILSLFGSWRTPGRPFEVYGELAWLDPPSSLEELVARPDRTEGYTIGMRYAPTLDAADGRLRVHVELTNLEQTPDQPTSRFPSFYVSPWAVQGYTHRGQVIGAATGPGSNSQFLALDFLREDWLAGVFGGRIRWENDVLHAMQGGPQNHDVSVYGGVRGAGQAGGYTLGLELAIMDRYDFLFQNESINFDADFAVDKHNIFVKLQVVPAN